MSSINKINVKDVEYIINEDELKEIDAKFNLLPKIKNGDITIRSNTVPANGYITYEVTFDEPFAVIPSVVLSSSESWFICSSSSVTKSGFSAVVRNISSALRPSENRTLSWIAISGTM